MTTPAAETSPAMAPALRRALMRANHAYFGWTVEQQERYRLTIPDDHAFLIEQQLFKELFDIEIQSEDDAEEAFNAFEPEGYLRYNSVILPIKGIGEDCFFLNEHLGEKTLLDFETLYDYDLDDHNFQETARQEESLDYVKKTLSRGALSRLGTTVCRRAIHLRHPILRGGLRFQPDRSVWSRRYQRAHSASLCGGRQTWKARGSWLSF